MNFDIEGLRVLVTAGADGIGKKMVAGFAGGGARVHTCDISEEAIAACRNDLPDVGYSLCDVADDDAVGRMFEEAAENLGGLDVLVNNAGIAGPIANLEDIEPDDWRRTVEIDLNSMYYCCRRAIPMLKATGGGCIVNMSSAIGRLGAPRRSPYAATKAAVIGLTKGLSQELGPHKIRVNCILPGVVEGARIRRTIAGDAEATGRSANEVTETYISRNVLHQFVEEQEIADMVFYLCSPSGRSITGQAVNVDADHQTLM
jgi:NAD(P)-dependent dehydrogenase (short-subunit alcohol dehydrogenase family)